ncbi:hypothetical protein B0H11DRAFT_226556 [Mycena galericulata]|nr:hypothetical protein B0H11DRAFT_226556 [Mycena galericulata]
MSQSIPQACLMLWASLSAYTCVIYTIDIHTDREMGLDSMSERCVSLRTLSGPSQSSYCSGDIRAYQSRCRALDSVPERTVPAPNPRTSVSAGAKTFDDRYRTQSQISHAIRRYWRCKVRPESRSGIHSLQLGDCGPRGTHPVAPGCTCSLPVVPDRTDTTMFVEATRRGVPGGVHNIPLAHMLSPLGVQTGRDQEGTRGFRASASGRRPSVIGLAL